MGLGKYLSENGERSSLRLNQLLVTIASLPVVMALAFYLVWSVIQCKITEINWAGWALGIGAIAAFYYQLWWGKAMNKKLEFNAKDQTIKIEGDSDNGTKPAV